MTTTTTATETRTDATGSGPVLEARGLHLAYSGRDVIRDLHLSIARGSITTIVGANGSGKSTLLKALGRVLTPSAGAVLLDGRPIRRIPTKDVARRLAILPQSPSAPSGITVRELVLRGRHPHQTWARPWSAEDAAVVDTVLRDTGVDGVADRPVSDLSGGQRQRVWIALVLAQQASTLLLDEPTTFLDLAHQIEVLRLVRRINRDQGATVVMVLHDLSLAARYSDRLVVLHDGQIVADGPPAQVLTPALLHSAFGLRALVVPDPTCGTPLIVPDDRDEASAPHHDPAPQHEGAPPIP